MGFRDSSTNDYGISNYATSATYNNVNNNYSNNSNNGLAPGWKECFDPTSEKTFYYHQEKKLKTWKFSIASIKIKEHSANVPSYKSESNNEKKQHQLPTSKGKYIRSEESTNSSMVSSTIDPGWCKLVDRKTGKNYYYDTEKQISSWDKKQAQHVKNNGTIGTTAEKKKDNHHRDRLHISSQQQEGKEQGSGNRQDRLFIDMSRAVENQKKNRYLHGDNYSHSSNQGSGELSFDLSRAVENHELEELLRRQKNRYGDNYSHSSNQGNGQDELSFDLSRARENQKKNSKQQNQYDLEEQVRRQEKQINFQILQQQKFQKEMNGQKKGLKELHEIQTKVQKEEQTKLRQEMDEQKQQIIELKQMLMGQEKAHKNEMHLLQKKRERKQEPTSQKQKNNKGSKSAPSNYDPIEIFQNEGDEEKSYASMSSASLLNPSSVSSKSIFKEVQAVKSDKTNHPLSLDKAANTIPNAGEDPETVGSARINQGMGNNFDIEEPPENAGHPEIAIPVGRPINVDGGYYHVPVGVNQDVPTSINQEVPTRINEEVPIRINQEVPTRINQEVPIPINKKVPTQEVPDIEESTARIKPAKINTVVVTDEVCTHQLKWESLVLCFVFCITFGAMAYLLARFGVV